MKNSLIIILASLMFAVNSWSIRFLQGWDDPNCSEWSDDGLICKKCDWRTYNNTEQNKCIRIDDFCKTWSQTNGECLTCYDGYGDAFYNGSAINGACPLFNGITPPPPPPPPFVYDQNCKCYSDNKTCLTCFDEFYLDQAVKCQPAPTGCRKFQNGSCTECLQDFFLDVHGVCHQILANCSKTDENGKCIQCDQGFYLSSDGICLQLTLNCAQFDADHQCLQCDDGYYLDTQLNCQFLPSNCNATDTNGVCIECQIGYFLDSQNQCQILPPNCFFTDSNGICTQCQDGYYLDVNRQCQLLPGNCLAANLAGKCTQCADGYNLNDGVCSKISVGGGGTNPDCAEQNSQGQCTKCRTFYTLSNGTCQPTGQNPFCKDGACQCGTGDCLQCKAGYFLDNHNVCILIAQNCKKYSQLNGECTSCNKNYTLTKGQCVPTVARQDTNLNCRAQAQNGTCTECRKYYNLTDGDCVPTGQNPKCHFGNSQGVCQCCFYSDLYYLDNNRVCQQKNANCKQFNPQNGQCTSCPKGYTLSNGECNSSG